MLDSVNNALRHSSDTVTLGGMKAAAVGIQSAAAIIAQGSPDGSAFVQMAITFPVTYEANAMLLSVKAENSGTLLNTLA